VEASRNLDQMLEVPGVDTYFFGPADFSASAGYPGQWQGPGVAEALLNMKDRIRAAGKNCGIIAGSPEDIHLRINEGFRMIAIGSDSGLLIKGLRQSLQSIGRDAALTTSLNPAKQFEGNNRTQ